MRKQNQHELFSMLLKRRIGKYLLKSRRGSLKQVAELLEVSPRTLNEWKRIALENKSQRSKGRPKSRPTLLEKLKISREWKRQGYPGSRAVSRALPGVRVRLIREVIASLKRRRRTRVAVRIKKTRLSIESKTPGNFVAIDGALLENGTEVIVLRDRASLLTRLEMSQRRVKSADTLRAFQNLESMGRLPLVVSSDNGSPFCSWEVTNYFRQKKIIHLRSLPHTPQHNGACEIAVREVKESLVNGIPIDVCCEVLNERRKRRRLKYQTAREFDEKRFVHYDDSARAVLYDSVCSAVRVATMGTKGAKESRKLERTAILETLERFGLIKTNRGSQRSSAESEDNA